MGRSRDPSLTGRLERGFIYLYTGVQEHCGGEVGELGLNLMTEMDL